MRVFLSLAAFGFLCFGVARAAYFPPPFSITNGGTGQTTANAAFNALVPSQTGNAGEFLTTDGSNTSWSAVSATPGGSTTEIQFNNAGAFGGDASFVWLATSNRVGILATPNTSLDVNGTVAHRVTSVNWVGNIPDLGTATTALVRLSGTTGPVTIQGLANGVDGSIVTIFNDTGRQVTLSNASGSASAANQITTGYGVDLKIATSSAAQLQYNSSTSKWRVISSVSAISDNWVSYTPTFTGFGTPTSVRIYSRRVGNSLDIRGDFTTGTTTAAEASITLGYNGTNGGLTIDGTTGVSYDVVGSALNASAGSSSQFCLIAAGDGVIKFGIANGAATPLVPNSGNTIAGSTVRVSFYCTGIPITGW